MYFSWNEDTIRWFCTASAYTGFHRRLAMLLRPKLTAGGTLADLGCGIGLVDLELASHVAEITCVDQSELPLAFLEKEAVRRGTHNLKILHADARALSGTWDHVLTIFYASGAELLTQVLPHCRKSLTAVLRGGENSAFGPDRWRTRHGDLAGDTIQALNAAGAVYTVEQAELEYGQPLESRADAEAFIRSGCPGISDEALEAYLAKQLKETGDPRCPLYLPNQKKFSILTLPKEENKRFIE